MKRAERINLAEQYIQKYALSRVNLTKEHLKALYLDMKLPLDIIAMQFQCSPRAVSTWIKKFGLGVRTVGEARSVHLNQDFFREWSREMAWVLGLCFTDGYFRKNQIRLALIDRETLEKVRNLVGPYLPIFEVPQSYDKSNIIFTLTFGNEEMARDLINLGMTTRKSLTMKFPDVPGQYIRDFIRGCWDGDGGFTLTNRKLCAHYTCGSIEFIEKIAQELFQVGIQRKILRGISVRKSTMPERRKLAENMKELRNRYGNGPYPLCIYTRKNTKAYDIRFSSDEQMLTFYTYIYEGDISTICMTRKLKILRRYLTQKNLVT